jgi:dynein heavy chain 1
MITRNSNAKFTPDLCSRVTFVNFTVTKSSLENQFKNIYLKNERPDVEQKRINLLKLQGEFIVKLRQLEDDLLNEISSS